MSSSSIAVTLTNGTNLSQVYAYQSASSDIPSKDDLKNAVLAPPGSTITLSDGTFLYVGQKPASDADTGAAILLNVNNIVNKYASSDAVSFSLVMCDSIDKNNGVSCAATGAVAINATATDTFFFTLPSYNIAADATAPLGFIVDDIVNDAAFAVDTGSGLQVVSRDKNIAPRIINQSHWWVWILALIILVVVIAVIGGGGYMYYKKRKSGGMY